jgi:riboflavin synthase
MFSGIISQLGNLNLVADFRYQILPLDNFLEKTKLGDSIAVDGVCLTVVELDLQQNYFIVDVSAETLSKAIFSKLVNLEHALKMGDSLDGHLVQGHVDTVIAVENITEINANKIIKFKLDPSNKNYIKYIAPKGAVCINGVSLTVNEVVSNTDSSEFTVNLIPYTLKNTNLQYLTIGSKVNLEIDMFARYSINFVENFLHDRV